jgi:serum/glucocorticoid-regulated kinase 2
MVTSKGVYNLDKKDVKRKIEMKKVTGITVGVPGSEFVIHVAE